MTKILLSQLGKRKSRYLEIAADTAAESSYTTFKHGAILIKGGSVIKRSFNKGSYSSFGHRFKNRTSYIATLHAELGVILGLDKSITRGSDVYVVRLNNSGEGFRMSKPCCMCHAALINAEVKRCYYSTNSNHLGLIKL